jgi:nanoRNase/pAp phosphatase (c-di-AMP/oligoRNAs hydrolase)
MQKMTLQVDNPVSRDQVAQLRKAAGLGPVLILTHDNPDPDGLASGKALAMLLSAWNIPSQMIYMGLVGRAENRAILRYLTPEWEFVNTLPNPKGYSAVALVDTQPGAGNNSLPDDMIPDIVIDHHHPIRPASENVRYADIRAKIGATVSMVYQYLDMAQVPIPPELATAMFYGLRSDTNGLSRGTTTTDGVIYIKLLDVLDHKLLLQVEQSGLAREYFNAFSRGLMDAQIVGKSITTYLGEMHRPDLVAEMADLLVRLEDVDAALCLGVYRNTLYFSLRTSCIDDDAGILVQQIIIPPGKAGGHGSIAGGQYPFDGSDISQVVTVIRDNFLRLMHESGATDPLLSPE